MSPFIIFAIVLTIAEILYFAAAISMDLHARSKKETGTTESIPIGDENDGDGFQTRAVTENMETGGFDITGTPSASAAEQISEADETTEASHAEDDTSPTPEIPDNAENDKAESGNAESENTEPSNTEPDSHPAENKEAQSEPTPTEEADAPKSENDIIPTVGFIEGQKPKQKPRPFVEAEVFNPDMVQPQYKVQSYIGTSANDEVEHKIESCHQNMKKNTTLGNLFNSKELKSIIQNNVESSNIDKRDEYTQC
jgi:hypothetical protein